MDISGKIIFASEPQGGVSQRSGTNWKSQDFVIETHDQYPRKCCFRVFGEDRLNQFNIQVGEELTVSIDIDAHEYNGRWFNDLRAWKVQRGVVNQAGAPVGVPVGTPVDASAPMADPFAGGGDSQDDLPF